MSAEEKKIDYTLDPIGFWNSDEEYNDRTKTYGHFTDGGDAFIVDDINTPKDWLNFMCNDKVTVCTNSRGQGFLSYRTLRLHITRYSNGYDYVPRSFTEGREFFLTDKKSGKKYELFRNNKNITCMHTLGYSVVTELHEGDFRAELKLFVPKSDPVECVEVKITDLSGREREFELEAMQALSFVFWSMIGTKRDITRDDVKPCKNGYSFSTDQIGIDHFITSFYVSPDYIGANDIEWREWEHPDITLVLGADKTPANGACVFRAAVGVCEEGTEYNLDEMIDKYCTDATFDAEFAGSLEKWDELKGEINCSIPDKNLERYLNYWFKNQTHLTFYNTRGSITGYRDVLQDTWGYSLLDQKEARRVLVRTLSYMQSDGVCPRQYDMVSFHHDMSGYMDSGSWIAMALAAYIKETGDTSVLDEKIGFIDSDEISSVSDHVDRAMNMLYDKRGQHGLCLAGDGDWNDALGGLKSSVGAESVWLTMALVNAQQIMAELCDFLGDFDKAATLRTRTEKLKNNINTHAWDGDWYVYAFFGDGRPIGSHTNKEGFIHLNAQTWAMFTGTADEEKCKKMYKAIDKHLATPLGPMLCYPPYIEENVGRMIYLRPGTFENSSVYQHAVSFKVMADAVLGNKDLAYETLKNILPVSDFQYDNMRQSEPYCTGNFYNGTPSPRFGQNYYGWFTGNSAWFMKIGFEKICGVEADYRGLRVRPMGPSSWDNWSVNKKFRGTDYHITFEKTSSDAEKGVYVDGIRIEGDLVEPQEKPSSEIKVLF